MEESKIIMSDMAVQRISGNQFSAEEETTVKKRITEKQGKIGNGQKGRCLAEVIELEIGDKLDLEDVRMKSMCQTVYKRCFKETKIGNMDSLKLSEKAINKFKKDIREFYGLNEDEMLLFRWMLQTGLNKMADEGILKYVPDKNIFYNPMDSKHRIAYISNPYSLEETEKIMRWAEEHPADVRSQAVSLWFTGGIALTEIVNLTKKDCWGGTRAEDSPMEFEENLFKAGIRPQIVWRALKMHPKEVKFVFVIPRQDGSGWKKLTETGLQRKLKCICRDIGIDYKRIGKKEAIKLER